MTVLERQHDKAVTQPLSREILLLDLKLADTPWSEAMELVVNELSEGSSLNLLRQPANDTLAINAYHGDLQIGTIPMEHTVVLARLMDAGKVLTCKVQKAEVKHDFMSGRPWIRILVKIYLVD